MTVIQKLFLIIISITMIIGIATATETNLDSGLVAQYLFNGNANDNTGHGHDGTIYGPIMAPDRFGNPNGAYYFDGWDDYIEVPDDPELKPQAITIVIWANTDPSGSHNTIGGPGDGYIIFKRNSRTSNFEGYKISGNPGGFNGMVTPSSGSPQVGAGAGCTPGEWHQVVMTADSQNIKMYLDGEFVSGSPTGFPLDCGSNSLFFGNSQEWFYAYYHGLIDEISIYSATLSADEIRSIYSNTAGQPPIAAFEASPTSGTAPLKVTFTDKSTGDGLSSRVWQYKLNSDSTWTTFTLDGPSTFTFTNAGSYDVKLTVTGTGGSNTKLINNCITVEPLENPSCSIVGQWDWNTAQDPTPPGTWVIDFHEDGTLYYDGIYYGTWQLMSENPQVYYLSWTHGYYDTLTMSSDCQMLDGYNQNGLHVYAYRRSTNPPPVADFEATPTSGSAPLKVTFTDKSTGDGITSRVWQFKLNSESEWTTFTLDKKSSHKFINDGIYDVKLTVTGSGGSDDEVKMNYIAVMGNQPPQVFFTYSPGSPNDNQQITFDASLSQDPDGKIISYQWDFGNREIKTKKSSTILYKYKDPGQYLVNLIVTDNEGASSSITKPVIINCPKCKIEVRAHPVPQFPLAYHLFIIYTDPQGKEFYFRGGPSKKSPVVIVTDSGKYKPKTDDWYPGAPTVTALSGWEAFNKDQCFVEELNRITSLKIPYGILGPNSNTVVSTLLDTCDVPRVKPDVDTPGWDSGNLDN